MLTLFYGLFVLAAVCYVLYGLADQLESTGGKLGKLLKLPESVIASTFQALATSGPEILMAILAATPFIAQEAWSTLQLGEKASSGTLNMAFSAMDNLLGIGAVAMIFMIRRGMAHKEELIKVQPAVKVGLIAYIISSTCLAFFINDSYLSVNESYVLLWIGIAFILSQFIIPILIKKYGNTEEGEKVKEDEYTPPEKGKVKELFIVSITYSFLVFALIVFVRESMAATFNMATLGIVSVGGILLALTSYVSSFPEFMMTFRFALANKKSAILGMLFGSNVIDLAFAGFRAMWIGEPIHVVSTGTESWLLNYYIYTIPILAVAILMGLLTNTLKYKIAYLAVVFYIIYIISGFILL